MLLTLTMFMLKPSTPMILTTTFSFLQAHRHTRGENELQEESSGEDNS